jgi:predicted Zn-dependent protease
MYSINRERTLGQQLSASVDRVVKLVTQTPVMDYVNGLGQKIARQSDSELPFTIKVIDSEDMGVFALPGGFLYVDRGLITGLDSEAELASMMAHEIAHVAARHATRAVTRKRIFKLITTAGMLVGPAGVIVENIGGLGGPLSEKKFDRDAEYEADLLGIEYIYAAGYDPEAFPSALERLYAHAINMQEIYNKIPGYKSVSKLPFHKQIATIFSDYPLMEDRIRRLQEEIVVFLPKREAYICDSSQFHATKAILTAAETPVLRHSHQGSELSKGPVLQRGRN